MRYFLIVLGFILVLGCPSPFVFADKLILKDGTRIEGEIVDRGEDYLKIKTHSGSVEIFNLDEVKYLKEEPVVSAVVEEIMPPEAAKEERFLQGLPLPQETNQNSQINEQIKRFLQAGAPKASQSTSPGFYDTVLTALSGNLQNIIQQYYQGIANAEQKNVLSTNPREDIVGIIKQYQNAMGEFDKTTQVYQGKK
jgi:hypothetical protein